MKKGKIIVYKKYLFKCYASVCNLEVKFNFIILMHNKKKCIYIIKIKDATFIDQNGDFNLPGGFSNKQANIF